MSQTYSVQIQHTIPASPGQVWQVFTDHENMRDWTHALKRTEMLKPGEPVNGKGAVRKLHFKSPFLPPIYEEIVYFSPPGEIHYELFKGMPGLQKHQGRVYLEPAENQGCHIRWEIDFVFKPFHIVHVVKVFFLRKLKKELNATLKELENVIMAQS